MDRHELLIRKPVKLESLEALLKRCLPTLTARIWEVCSWPDSAGGQWNIGDFRFIVVDFNPSGDDGASLYVQIWSEPFEPATMEVSSGHRNAAAVAHVWREQRQSC